MANETGVVACIDSSGYAEAVGDYAAWLAGPMEAPLSLLHVSEPPEPPDVGTRLLARARRRLVEQGLDDVRLITRAGAFADNARDLSGRGRLLVMGKRGEHAFDDRQVLGSNVDTVVRGATAPVCLVSNLYLPISRALVLLDADPEHRRTVEFVHAQAWLADLEIELMMMTDGGPGGEAKLSWAREMLSSREADIFPMPVDGPHEALARYRRHKPIDLLILSREIALSADTRPLREIESDSVWAWRAPVLIC